MSFNDDNCVVSLLCVSVVCMLCRYNGNWTEVQKEEELDQKIRSFEVSSPPPRRRKRSNLSSDVECSDCLAIDDVNRVSLLHTSYYGDGWYGTYGDE